MVAAHPSFEYMAKCIVQERPQGEGPARIEVNDDDEDAPDHEHKYDEGDEEDDLPLLIPPPPSLPSHVALVCGDPPATAPATPNQPLSDITNVAAVSARKRSRAYSERRSSSCNHKHRCKHKHSCQA